MAITPTGDRNVDAAVTRAARVTWFGAPSTVTEHPPHCLNNENVKTVNAAGTSYINLIKADASDVVTLTSGVTVPTTKTINVVDPAGLLLNGVAAFTSAGALASTAGISQSSATGFTRNYAGEVVPSAMTSGTDTTGINGKVWISEVFIPANCSITGISYLIGSVGGTDKVVVALFDSSGAVVANSAVDSSVTVGTTATFQRVPFTAPYAAKGPGLYFVGVTTNGTTAKLRTQVAGDHATMNVSQTFNTLVAIAPPTTFTTNVAPIAMTY